MTLIQPLRRAGSLLLVNLVLLLRRGLFRALETAGVLPAWDVALGRGHEESSSEWRAFLSALDGIRNLSQSMGLPPPLFAVLDHGTSKGGEAETARRAALNEVYARRLCDTVSRVMADSASRPGGADGRS